ncbi:unnamed protein product [Effrenium voratum]|nr:unnamed protein product [Effrenium voratum]
MPWPKLWQSYNSDLRLPIGDKASTLRSGSKETVSDGDLSPQTPGFLRSSTRSLNLDEVLRSEFRGAYAEQDVNKQHSDLSDDQNDCRPVAWGFEAAFAASTSLRFAGSLPSWFGVGARFVDSWGFMATFLVLTESWRAVGGLCTVHGGGLAERVEDLDTIFGTPTSKHVLSIPAAGLKAESLSSRVELEGQVLEASGIWVVLQVLSWPDGGWLVSVGICIVTTVIFGLFLIDARKQKAAALVRSSVPEHGGAFFVLLCLFKAGYAFRAFFWLDMVALISLLPETWFVQQLFDTDTLVAGRSTRLMKAIRLVVRSSKATRLNRFTRMVRVSAMLPRMFNAAKGKPDEGSKDVENLLERKLHRLFMYLDKDNDGMVSAEMVDVIVRRIIKKRRRRRSLTRLFTSKLGGPQNSPGQNSEENSDEAEPPCDTVAHFRPRSRSVTIRSERTNQEDGTQSAPFGGISTSLSQQKSSQALQELTRRRSRSVTIRTEDCHDGTNSSAAAHPDMDGSTSSAVMLPQRLQTLAVERVLEDELVKSKLVYACQSQLGKGASMKNIGRSHVEDRELAGAGMARDVGVKVALLVILLLFVLSFVAPTTKDRSMPMVLEQLDLEASYRFSDWNASTLPQDLLEASVLWKEGMRQSMPEPTLLYLDLNARVLCSEMGGVDALKCSQLAVDSLAPWPSRTTLDQIDAAIKASPYRTDDIEMIRQPVLDHVDTSLETWTPQCAP